MQLHVRFIRFSQIESCRLRDQWSWGAQLHWCLRSPLHGEMQHECQCQMIAKPHSGLQTTKRKILQVFCKLGWVGTWSDRWVMRFPPIFSKQSTQVHSPSLRTVWLRCRLSAGSPPRSPVSAGSWWISGWIRLPSPHRSDSWAQIHRSSESPVPALKMSHCLQTRAHTQTHTHTLIRTRVCTHSHARQEHGSLHCGNVKSASLRSSRKEMTFNVKSLLTNKQEISLSFLGGFYFEANIYFPVTFFWHSFYLKKCIFALINM